MNRAVTGAIRYAEKKIKKLEARVEKLLPLRDRVAELEKAVLGLRSRALAEDQAAKSLRERLRADGDRIVAETEAAVAKAQRANRKPSKTSMLGLIRETGAVARQIKRTKIQGYLTEKTIHDTHYEFSRALRQGAYDYWARVPYGSNPYRPWTTSAKDWETGHTLASADEITKDEVRPPPERRRP